MRHTWRIDLLAAGIFLLFVILFFHRLWIPERGIFVIPEFGLSDTLHSYLPGKLFVSNMLASGQWPLWTPYIGTGFPFLAEGLMGVFYLPNLVLFRFLSVHDAYALSLAGSFFIAAWGMYLFCRTRMTLLGAVVCGLTFAFCGYFSVQLNHLNYIQSASLLPLILFAVARLHRKPSLASMLLISLLFWQQMLTGGYQFVWITGLLSLTYILLWPAHRTSGILRRTGLFFGSIILATGLAGVQLFPTLELLRSTDRSQGLSFDTVTEYPYPLKHLASFFSPYMFGSPAEGTYPVYGDAWGLFWENTAYIGILPVLLALSSLVWYRRARVMRWWGIVGIAVLLVLGKNSPLYFLYAFPLFSNFRVPSRFLIVVVFCLICLYGEMIDRILRRILHFPSGRRMIGLLILVLVVSVGFLDEYRFSYEYPPVTPIRWWTAPSSQTSAILDTAGQDQSRIYTLQSESAWNGLFLKKGTKDISLYRQYLSFFRPNANVLFSIRHAGMYVSPGIIPKRMELVQDFMGQVAPPDATSSSTVPPAKLSPLGEMVLLQNAVSSVFSPFPLSFSTPHTRQTVPLDTGVANQSVYITKLSPLPRARLAFSTHTIATVEDAVRTYAASETMTMRTALVEDDRYAINQLPDSTATAIITRDDPMYVSVQTRSTKPSILILADSYYPGWQATDNGTPTDIFPVNISQRGVLLKEGSHQIEFFYKPQSFETGKLVTYATGTITLLLLFVSRIHAAKRIKRQ